MSGPPERTTELPPDIDRYRAAAGLSRRPVTLAPAPSRPRRTLWRDRDTPARERLRRPAGSVLVGSGAWLLGLLAVALFVVTLNAQYKYVFAVKHQTLPAYIEAASLDLGMAIFTLLALGLAVAGQTARLERILIVACAAGSAAQCYAAADPTSPRSVAAYVVPSLFLALVVDRVVAVLRRHALGPAEKSVWVTVGGALGRAVRAVAVAGLYLLRLLLAPPSTFGGLRQAVLAATPVPARPEKLALATPERSTPERTPPERATPERTTPERTTPEPPARTKRTTKPRTTPARTTKTATVSRSEKRTAELARIVNLVRHLETVPGERALAAEHCGGSRRLARDVLATLAASQNGTRP